MKACKKLLSLLLACSLVLTMLPVFASAEAPEEAALRSVHSGITIDENPDGGYTGDYVVIYNPSTSAEDACSTGDMTGLIDTAISADVLQRQRADEEELYIIDVDDQMARLSEEAGIDLTNLPARRDAVTTYAVGDTLDFVIYAPYSPTGSDTVTFKCLHVGEHCYIWTPVEDNGVTYPLDTLDASFAGIAAAEFDSKFDLMQSSFGEHFDFGTGDNRLHMLYYNINEGWEPGRGYIAGFFYAADLYNNNLPILNIDTYPGVVYPNYYGEGKDWVRMNTTYHTMVHEYQHLINFSNNYAKGTMHSWLNECFSAGAEEICYPGSSVVSRIQAWEQFYPSDEAGWLTPPEEFAYQPSFNLHNGYSLYDWSNDLPDVLALYAQVSFFAQYLYTRFDNSIYRQINDVFEASGKEAAAISKATGVDCSQLAREYRVAVTANAAQDQYDGVYGFKAQDGYDPEKYHNVSNPWDLLGPVVFTGTSCEIKGGGAITVKPVGGVYNPPADADADLQYVGVKLTPPATYTVEYLACAVSEGSETVTENNSITLPTSVSNEVEGWSFAGWTEQSIAETDDAPTFLAPGASYTPTGDVTLYALYTRTVGSATLYRSDPLTTHTPVLVPAVSPNCTAPGNNAYYACETCDKFFSDEACTEETTPEAAAIPAVGHTAGEPVRENETAPTCEGVGGYDMATYCTVCKAELSREHTEIDPTGHTPGEPVRENETAPTCEGVGGYDMATYCTVCKAELSREHTEIDPTGHDWGKPGYVWADDWSTATATRVCKHDESHIETETVNTTAEIIKEATCDEEGETKFTAVFTNEAFTEQTQTVVTPKLEKPLPQNPFEDVKEGAFYYDAVLWAVGHDPQITQGTNATHFSPDAKCTRGQVVTFLWRAKGSPEPEAIQSMRRDGALDVPFDDIKTTDYFYKAVLWAVENGITTGTGGGKFSPNQGCTRGQVVTFLWRTEGKPEPEALQPVILNEAKNLSAGTGEDSSSQTPQNDMRGTNPFSDVKDSDYFYKAVLWAVEKNITQGTGGGKFSPGATCTRGQIVTFLYRDLA